MDVADRSGAVGQAANSSPTGSVAFKKSVADFKPPFCAGID
jgi:hypothetical protein